MTADNRKPQHYTLVDPNIVRRRRLQLGISEKAIAKRPHVAPGTILTLESGGDQRHHDGAFFTDLANELETTLQAILAPAAGPSEPETARHQSDDHVATIGAYLANAGGPVPVESLCRLTDQTLPEINSAVTTLSKRLGSAGYRLHRDRRGLTICPAHITDHEALQDATRQAVARGNLGADRAAMLHDLLAGERQIDPRFEDHWVGGQLANAGFIDRSIRPNYSDKNRTVRLTDDVRYSLGIADN